MSSAVDKGKLVAGVGLLVVGLALTATGLDILPSVSIFQFWPLLLVVLGAVTTVTEKDAGSTRKGLWLMLLGIWLLVSLQGFFGLGFSTSWPLIIMGAGVVDLIQPEEHKTRFSCLWPLGVGFWLLVSVWGLWGLSFATSWPLLLVLLGTEMIAKAIRRARGSQNGQKR